MIPVVSVKQNDSLYLAFTRRDFAGDIVSIANMTVSSQLRGGGQVFDLTVDIPNPASGQGTLNLLPAETGLVPARMYMCDIEFVQTDRVVSSKTFIVQMLEDVTDV